MKKSELLNNFKNSLLKGDSWIHSLFETISVWEIPTEIYRGREYIYLIEGEAFDWILLAERICGVVNDLLPERELKNLLFYNEFPESFHLNEFKSILGIDKFRGYLNYFYGVTIESSLQMALELEIQKRHISNSFTDMNDFTDDAYFEIYGKSREELLKSFLLQKGDFYRNEISLQRLKEFTYWLFKYRLSFSDSAKIASDTQKGLLQLEKMSKKKLILAEKELNYNDLVLLKNSLV